MRKLPHWFLDDTRTFRIKSWDINDRSKLELTLEGLRDKLEVEPDDTRIRFSEQKPHM
jgi:hypothetical protein